MFKTFEEAEAYYYGLWYSENPDFKKALEVASWCYGAFPEHKNQLMLDLGILHGKLGQTDESLRIFHEALDAGIWYPKVFIDEFWSDDWFVSVVERWLDYSQEDRFTSEVSYDFLTPRALSKDKPVFIALHGWGEDIPLFKQFWTSARLKNDFNTVFVQSSQMVGAYHYQWTDYELAKKDIHKILSILSTEYGLDTSEIVVGGFSEGATTSLRLAFEENDFNVTGFVALNPNLPEEINTESIRRLKEQEIRGGIITGDQDECFEEQLRMKQLFDTQEYPVEWIVTKDFGHWFPKDLSQKIDHILIQI